MRICRFSWNKVPDLPPSVLAAGFFDGFHLGHRALLEKARQEAQKAGLEWGVLTFDPDPWTVFRPGDPLEHIQSLQDREKTARALGADLFCIIEFTKEFAGLSPEAFHQVLEQMHVRHLVTGFDFRYGARNSGDVHSLDQAPFPHSVVQAVEDSEGKISSTRIEAAVLSGEMTKAAAMLGQDYSVPGTVVHGFGRGSRLLGFPTANLQPETGYLIPAGGVYAGFVLAKGQLYPAMINVGSNPTFRNRKQTLEACLFGFDGDLYGKPVRFFFSKRLRPEVRFEHAQALKTQLAKDKAESLKVLKGHDPDPLQIHSAGKDAF